MNITEIAIKRPVMAWMVMGALIFFGIISFQRMGVSQMPDVDFPVITVSIGYPGAAPEIIESDVVDIVEDAIMGVEGVKSITSTCRNGSARISIEFDLNRKVDVALQEVQAKLAQAQRLLPDAIDPPVISKSNPEDQPIMWITVSSEKRPRKEIMTYVRDIVKNKFTSLPGVGDVMLGGYVDPALRVWVNKKALNQYNLTVQDIINSIQSEHVELPAGSIDNATKQFTIRTMGEAGNVKEFENIRMNSRGGQPNFIPLYLRQVASIDDSLADVQRISRANGKAAVGLGILKQRGSNAVEVGNSVKERIKSLQKELPPDFNIGVRIDTTKFISEAVHELLITLIIAVFLTSFVCWLFLGSWSATFNVLLAIPTSIIGTFIVLYFSHFTLNTFTLMALSLAIGIVVDDAIMVLENIIRHNQKGQSRLESARQGTREISFAALAATLAIIAIFLPVAFMSGIIGKFFFQFGVTMTVAVALSLFEALTLTPMRCSQFIGAEEHATFIGKAFARGFEGVRTFYRYLLEKALKVRIWVIIISLLLFSFSLIIAKHLRSEFVPAQDQSMFLVRVKAPAGSSLEYTDNVAKQIESFLSKRQEIEGYFSTVGGFGGNDATAANIFVSMKPKAQRGVDKTKRKTLSQLEFMNLARGQLKKNIKGAKIYLQDLSMRSFGAGMGFPVEFTVRGPDWDTLGKNSMALLDKLEQNPSLTDVGTDYILGMQEIEIIPDRQQASLRGVSLIAIGQTIQAMVGGLAVSRFEANGHRYDIIVKLPKSELNDTQILDGLYVRNNRGETIPLYQLVKVVRKPVLQSITRIDRERAITIFANIKTGASQAEVIKQIEQIAKNFLPPGYRIVMSGNAKAARESMQSLLGALVLGILIAYMILASQFNSYKHPFIILLALPFSVTGALIALLLTNQSLSIYSMIGLILLMGIVKKNSILLVDFTNQMRDTGKDVKTALLEACPIRLRPILMTSLATIAGAVPSALATGPGAETRIPMAVAVIGGVLVSTLLTLFVVPCFYSLTNKDKKKLSAKKSKIQ
ncbi:MAG: efflux RND transporter permease subunit [Candidatus Margulisbacteria bacterium]|nr:efflux RND transporter permease subunit [Candidatus Margulisiibacteriota bacterium]